MKLNDKSYLEFLANKILSTIKGEGFSAPFNAHKTAIVERTNTDGWVANLGVFRGYQVNAEIWCDKFSKHKTRKIYYGVLSKKNDRIDKISALCKPGMGEPIVFSSSNVSQEKKIVQLKEMLPDNNFSIPILEKYTQHKIYYFGIYEHQPKGLNEKETQRLITSIVDFFVSINSAMWLETSKDAKSYTGLENQKFVQQYLQRGRNRYVANRRKQNDKYICGICGFDFSKTYGELGNGFAEAHHIVPLRTDNKERKTTIDDLITVCANCHRMLDRMKGTPADIENLKQIVSKSKTSSSAK